ncbi:hypothetical protein COOONC_03445, partial [Cooperia oncophora]
FQGSVSADAEAKKRRDVTVAEYSAKEQPPVTAAQTAAFEGFARVVFSMGIDGLIREYNDFLKPYVSYPFKRDAFDQNTPKNRYKGISLCHFIDL